MLQVPVLNDVCEETSHAHRLGRSPSTISREITRHGGRRTYRALRADKAARVRALRPKPSKLAADPLLGMVVTEKLAMKWSPEQIAGWLARQYPDRPEMRVSHETIYRSLFVQSRGALRRELTRPRKTLEFMTPSEKYNEAVATTR